jgi:3-oxoacyl-[acyl-carrier protein] reductase
MELKGKTIAITGAAQGLARHNIRVAAIAPGFCRTQMVEAMPDKILDKLRAQIPAGRLGDPEEVAHAAQFIFENDYFNGRILALDGGLRL